MKKSISNSALCLAILLSAALSTSASPSSHGHSGIERLSSPGTEDLDLPFSAAVRAGDFLFLSGAVGNLPGTRDLAPGGIQAETRQVMENIKTTLGVAGAGLDQVVKCTVFLADIDEWAAMNEVYRTYFDGKPARSALGASGLALGARVEIECLAWVGQ